MMENPRRRGWPDGMRRGLLARPRQDATRSSETGSGSFDQHAEFEQQRGAAR